MRRFGPLFAKVAATALIWTSAYAEDRYPQQSSGTSSQPGTWLIERAEIERSGWRSLPELLRDLPTTTAGINRSDLNSGGREQADLRGLGAEATLILLNGRRLPTYGNGAVDLNVLTPELIQLATAAALRRLSISSSRFRFAPMSEYPTRDAERMARFPSRR